MKHKAKTIQLTDADQRDAMVERLLASCAGFFDMYTIYIGHRLELYNSLADAGPVTAADLARRTGTDERYVREWLEQQTVAGIIAVEGLGGKPSQQRFRLPPGHAEVLTHRESLSFLAPLAQLLVGTVRPLNQVVEAFHSGRGVAYANYGPDMRNGVAELNRPMYMHQLGSEYLPAIGDIHARLTSLPPARVADIGCGTGWSSIGMARAYPHIRVDAFDADPASIGAAQENLRRQQLNHRVRFMVSRAEEIRRADTYDLVVAFECIHDMADPVGVLMAMRQLAGHRGSVLVMDQRTQEAFSPGSGLLEAILYGFSVLACLPAGRAQSPSAATGTVMRPATLEAYAAAARFSKVEILPLENFFFRFYRLWP